MRRVVPIALICAVLVVAGCGSSGGTPAATNTQGTSETEPGGGETGHPAPPPTATAVRRAYSTFFSSKTSLSQSILALQHGTVFTVTLREQGQSQRAQQSGASVSTVQLLSPNVAEVRFSVTSNGVTALTNVPGKAVLENGHWKVAAETFCELLRLEGSAPKACNDPKITALPSS